MATHAPLTRPGLLASSPLLGLELYRGPQQQHASVQAGGASPSGLTDSILEVPTYTIALVFLFFLIVSTIFEGAVHWLTHKFEQWGRVGLVEALQKLVQELTLLGLISLILVTFQTSLTKFCVNYSDTMAQWTLIDNIDGCPCCLVHTKGVSTCAQIDHFCLVNATNNYSPYCACGQPPEEVLSHEDSTCATYQGGELQYFLNQVPSTVALTSKVYQLVYDNVTVDDLCDSFCCVANVTWNSNDLRDITNDDVQCDPLLIQHSDSGGGRRLLEAPHGTGVTGATAWEHPEGLSLASFLAAGHGVGGVARRQPVAKATAAGAAAGAGDMQPVEQLAGHSRSSSSRSRKVELSDTLAGRRAHPQQRRRLQQAPSGQSTDGSGDQASDVDEDLLIALDSMIHAHEHKTQGGRKKANETEVYVVPGLQTFKCTGPFLASTCPDGQVPAISNSAMHQIHLWVFLIAIFHVTTSIVMIILSGYRLRQWRRWQVLQVQGEAAEEAADRQEEEDEMVVEMGCVFPGHQGRGASGDNDASPHQPASPVVDTWKARQGQPAAEKGAVAEQAATGAAAPEPPLAQNGSNGLHQRSSSGSSSDDGDRPGNGIAAGSLAESLESDPAPGTAEADGEAPTRLHNAAHALPRAGSTASSASLAKGEVAKAVLEEGPPLAAPIKPSTCVDETGLATGGGSGPPLERQTSRQASRAASSWCQLQRRWYRRSTMVRRRRDFAMEAFTVATQALMPNLVRRHQFLMIRSAYIACSDPGARQPAFDFVKHMLLCLERDASRIVGLSLEMWLVVIVWVLLSGLVTWSGQIFLWGAAALLLGVDLTLVAILRYACRGSQPMLFSGQRRLASWLRAELLLIPIRMILFLCSLLYSTTVFLAWQFGAKSCWFSGDSFLWYAVAGGPWWMGLVLGSILLLWVSLVTIPAYSLAVHATRQEDPPNQVEELPPVARTLLRQMSLAHQASHIRSQEELGALQEENLRLRRLLSVASSAGSPPNVLEGVEGGPAC